MTFQVPEQLALHHGGKDLLPGALKFAETFEVWGGMRVTGVFAGAWTGRQNVTDNQVRHNQDVIVAEII